MTTDTPAVIRARELIGMLSRLEGPDLVVDRGLAQLFHLQSISATFSIDEASRLVRRYYQWGVRQYASGEHGAYVEVNGTGKKGFVWKTHKFAAIALAMAALESHIEENQ